MQVNTQAIHFKADEKLIQFIEKKLHKLETFYDKILSSDVYLKLEKNDNQENKVVEIKLFIPGGSLFVKERSNTFEAATDSATETLKKQVKRHKEKMREAS